jgi:lipopolysaccharide export system protein LptA
MSDTAATPPAADHHRKGSPQSRRGWRLRGLGLIAVAAGLSLSVSGLPAPAFSQAINMSQGGPITVTSQGGIEWRQVQQEVIATQDAKAVRGNVTVTADQLIAHYRKKAGSPSQPAAPAGTGASAGAGPSDGIEGNNQIYLLEAQGDVHIFTSTDRAVGDHGAYDLDQAVLVLTGHDLRLTTPSYVVTSRDSLEYWSNQHMAVARGDAVLVTNTGRRVAADVLVAYTDSGPASGATAQGAGAAPAVQTAAAATPGGTDPADPASGKLKLVDAIGHVVILTATDIVQGDRAVYDPGLNMARIAGHVHITRGQNELVGSEALVNMQTGVSRLLSLSQDQVKGLIMPNQANQAAQASSDGPGSKSPPSH